MPYHDKYSYPGFSKKDLNRLADIHSANPWILADYTHNN